MDRDASHPSALIVCVSEHHGNTRLLADVLAETLDAEVVEPEAVDVTELPSYDLLAFGSGIYFGSVDDRLLDLVDRMPHGAGRAVLTFSTSGMFLIPWMGTSVLRRRLRDKGYRVLDDFNCRGYDTAGPLRFIGGINQGRPNANDLDRARRFARVARVRSVGVSPATV